MGHAPNGYNFHLLTETKKGAIMNILRISSF